MVHKGDLNISFFHKNAKIRKHINYISHILDISGNVITDHDQITQIFVDHFTHLWKDNNNTSFDFIFDAMPNDLPIISTRDNTFLTRKVTKDEVFITLNSLPLDKSHGPDDFNFEFYKYFWGRTFDHLFLAIKTFFEIARMHKAWGRTFVALIPKIDHPKNISDFRPIFLYNVCYKIKGIIGT